MRTHFITLFFFILTTAFTIGCGTLGSFDGRTLPVPKAVLEEALDTLYRRYPDFNIPDKWKQFDTWAEKGYGFLESRILYFKSVPEEMYYVTLDGDSSIVTIAIRAVDGGNGRWKKAEDFGNAERVRIQKRFDTAVIMRLKAIIAE